MDSRRYSRQHTDKRIRLQFPHILTSLDTRKNWEMRIGFSLKLEVERCKNRKISKNNLESHKLVKWQKVTNELQL